MSFFFVLSGFVLAWSTPSRVAQARFYRRRFARIYPAYLVTLTFTLLVPVVAAGRGVPAVLLGVLLLQAWSTSSTVAFGCNDIAWSLSCEAFFYALFPIILQIMRRTTRRRLLTWVTGIYGVAAVLVIAGAVASQITGDGALNNLVYTDPLIRLPEFLLGMAAGIAFAEGWRPRISLRNAVAALAGLYVVLCLVQAPGPLLDAVTPLLFVAIVLAAATDDLIGAQGWLSHPWLVYAGQVSFCFYLVHEIVIINVRQIVDGPPGALLCLIIASAAAVALHHFVELPLQRRVLPRVAPRPLAGPGYVTQAQATSTQIPSSRANSEIASAPIP